jgi:hypothetical protein
MTHIDSVVLDLTEWFCRKFQLLTGRTNVWLAVQLTNLSIIVYFVWAGVYFWTSDAWLRIAVGLFCSGLFYVLTQTIFKVSIEAYENNAYHRVAKGLRNPRRIRDAFLRISFLTLSIVLFYPILFVYLNLRAYLHFRVDIALLSYSLIVLTTVVLYMLACDPLPPCAGKVREWLRGSAPSRLAASESAGGRGELAAQAAHVCARKMGRRKFRSARSRKTVPKGWPDPRAIGPPSSPPAGETGVPFTL